MRSPTTLSTKNPGREMRKGYQPRPFSEFWDSPSQISNQSRASSTHSWVDQALAVMHSPNESSSRDNASQPRHSPPDPFIASLSTSETGSGTITRFYSPPVSNSSNSSSMETGRQSNTTRPNGTGAHDDAMTRARPNYREPSLRRGSGIVVETPKAIRHEISNRKKEGRWRDPFRPPAQDNAQDVGPIEAVDGTQSSLSGCNATRQHVREDSPSTTGRNHTQNNTASLGRDIVEFTDKQKLVVIRRCLEKRDEYFHLPDDGHGLEVAFWNNMYRVQPYAIRFKLLDGLDLKWTVDSWCSPRRQQVSMETVQLPKTELEDAIDNWVTIWARRLCRLHSKLITNNIRDFVEKKTTSIMRKEVGRVIEGLLQERGEGLARLTRPAILQGPTNFEEYSNLVRLLKEKVSARGNRSYQVQQTEALASLIFDLQPRLEQDIIREMRGEQSSPINEASGNDLSEEETEESLKSSSPQREANKDVVLPSIETEVPLQQLPSAGDDSSPVVREKQQQFARKQKRTLTSCSEDNQPGIKRVCQTSQHLEPPSSPPATFTMSLPTRIKAPTAPDAAYYSTAVKTSAKSSLDHVPARPEKPETKGRGERRVLWEMGWKCPRKRMRKRKDRRSTGPGNSQAPPSSGTLNKPETPRPRRESTPNFNALSAGARDMFDKSIHKLKKRK